MASMRNDNWLEADTIAKLSAGAALFACLSFLVLCPARAADPGVQGAFSVGLTAQVLEDPGGEMTIEDVRARDSGFSPLLRPELPQSHSAWWFKITVDRAASAGQDWVLVAGIPTLLDVALYSPAPGGFTVALSGAAVPQSQRPLASFEPRFPVRLQQGTQTFYLRVQDPVEVNVPLLLVDAAARAERDRLSATWISLFMGMMLGLLVYNLFLYLSLRDWTYGLYVLSGTSLLFCFLVITGRGSLHFWPEAAGFETLARLLLPAVWGFFYWRFMARFFSLEETHPGWNRLVAAFSGLFALVALASLTGERYYVSQALHTLAIFALPWVFVIGVIRWRDGFRPAGIIVLGQLALVLPTLFLAMRISGLVPDSPLIDNGLLIGAATETLLFAMALAQRIRDAEAGRDRALGMALNERQARLEQVEAHNVQLEQRVSERTAELEQANRDLESQKARLAEEASQDNLTGLANRRALARRFQLVSDLSARSGEPYALLLIDLDGFKRVNDSAGHDAGDTVLQVLAQRLQGLVRAGDTLARVGGDEFVVLMAQNADAQEAMAFATRLVSAVREDIEVDGRSHRLGASVGICLGGAAAISLSDMMRQADRAMYEAKRGDASPRIRVAAAAE